MRMPRIAITVALVLGLTPLLVAQSSWEGSAVVARYGEFPPGGLYAASNTFPLNSLVDITNPETGRSVRLIIANRINDSGVFLLLSETAADELGIARGASASVRAEPVQLPGLTAVEPSQDLPFSPDPDVNPAASLGDPNTAIINPAAVRREEAEALTQAAEEQPEPVAEPAPVSEPRVEPAPEPAAVVAQAEPTPEPEREPDPESEPEPEQTPEPEPESQSADTATPEPSIAAVVNVEPEDEPEIPTEEPAVDQPQLEDLESPDRIADAGAEEDVIGVAPEPPVNPAASSPTASDQAVALERPESPSPNVYPTPRPPLVVELDTPPDPPIDGTDEAVEIAIPVEEAPAIVATEEPVVDPLDERLAAIERYLDEQRVSSAPLEADPVETIGINEPVVPAQPAGPLPEVNPSVAFDAEVSDPLPPIPNPVRLSVILPEIEDVTAPEIAEDLPSAPEERVAEIELPLAPLGEDEVEITVVTPQPRVLAEDEIALPLVPLEEDVEVSERLADAGVPDDDVDVALAEPSPDAEAIVEEVQQPEESIAETEPQPEPDPGAEALRPTLIPEDAIISLEPADYRSPDPPQPAAEDLPPETAEPGGELDAELAEAPVRDEAAAGAVTEAVEERPAAVVTREEPAVEERPEVAVAEPERVAPVEEAPAAVVAPGEGRVWAENNLPLVTNLERDSVYVQVAAFANPRSAKQTVERLGDRYPIAVLTESGDREFYRVFVGPLNEDEKGSALFQIRSRGFRDAFLRQ